MANKKDCVIITTPVSYTHLDVYKRQGKTITPFVLPIVFAEAENSNGLLKVLIYLGCVMLFCNAPFLNNQKPYMILRCKRKGWYLGENMYVWLAAFLYMLFISLISLDVYKRQGQIEGRSDRRNRN